ncbi:MAG: ComF family protein [Alphaproteobacteria bacterium]|nr:ComF family protein [Alphaproteobacteria bacterium]
MSWVGASPPRLITQALARARPFGAALIETLYPPQCLACRVVVSATGALCAACWGKIRFIEAPHCPRCSLPFDGAFAGSNVCGACLARPPRFDAARAVFVYDEASKGMVLAFKHGDRLDHAPPFARWMARVGSPLIAASDLIVPIPLHRWRLFRRRYNQAAVLAQALGRLSGLPVAPLSLEKVRATPSQGEMRSARARRRNVAGAFRVPPAGRPVLRGRRILLVDDVMTTGATLNAATRALRQAGAEAVTVLVLARVLRPGEIS